MERNKHKKTKSHWGYVLTHKKIAQKEKRTRKKKKSGEKKIDVEARVWASIYNLWGPRPNGSVTRPKARCHISMQQATCVWTCNPTVRSSELHPSRRKERPSECFTLKNRNWRKNCRKNIFPNVSFRTRMYNQVIKHKKHLKNMQRSKREF